MGLGSCFGTSQESGSKVGRRISIATVTTLFGPTLSLLASTQYQCQQLEQVPGKAWHDVARKPLDELVKMLVTLCSNYSNLWCLRFGKLLGLDGCA